MNRRRLIVLAAGLSGLGAMRWLAADQGKVGKPAPQFEAVDSTGRKRQLAEFKGKTVVIEWTSPSCPFVRAQYESGSMQELQRRAAKQGVIWLSVLSTHPSRRDYLPPAKAEAMSRARDAAPTALLLDPEGAMGRAYGAVVTPHMFIITTDGRLGYAGAIDDSGAMDPDRVRGSRNYVRSALEDIASGRKVATPTSRPFGCTIAYRG